MGIRTIEDHLELAKMMKTELVAGTTPDQIDDIVPIIVVQRDGDPLAVVRVSQVDRDEGLAAAELAVTGFGADAVTFITDAHMTTSPVDPRTGERWAPDAMQNFCDNEGACDLGILTDTLTAMRVQRNGHIQLCSRPYHVHKTARTIAWIEDHEYNKVVETSKTAVVVGYLAETLSGCFTRPSLKDTLLRQGLLPLEQALHVDDVAIATTMSALQACGWEVTLTVTEAKKQAIVDQALKLMSMPAPAR